MATGGVALLQKRAAFLERRSTLRIPLQLPMVILQAILILLLIELLRDMLMLLELEFLDIQTEQDMV